MPFRLKVDKGGRTFAGSAANGRHELRWIGVRCEGGHVNPAVCCLLSA